MITQAIAAACAFISCVAPISQDIKPNTPMYSWYENASHTVHIAPDVTDVDMATALIIHEENNAAHPVTAATVAQCTAQDTDSYMVALMWWHQAHLATWPRIESDGSLPALGFAQQMYREWSDPSFLPLLVAAGCSPANGWLP